MAAHKYKTPAAKAAGVQVLSLLTIYRSLPGVQIKLNRAACIVRSCSDPVSPPTLLMCANASAIETWRVKEREIDVLSCRPVRLTAFVPPSCCHPPLNDNVQGLPGRRQLHAPVVDSVYPAPNP